MSKQILIISTSLRTSSNSDQLAEEWARGAREAGNTVETVSLREKTIGFCKGCLACQTTRHCVIQDDANAIVERMLVSDVIVFATPVYYYELCGQMKTLLDRANPLYVSDYQFRDVYLLATAADEDAHAVDGPVNGLKGWISCFEKARLAGTVFAGGVDAAGAIEGHPALREAYEMGAAIH